MGNARRVGNAENRNLCHLVIMGNAPYHKALLFHRIILPNDCAWFRRECGAYMDGDVVVLPHLHRAGLHDTGTETSHFQHLAVGDLLHLARILAHPRVSRENPFHIGEDLTGIRPKGTGQGHRRGVRAAASQGHRIAILIRPLEACNDDDVSLLQLLLHTVRLDVKDASLGMHGIGPHANHGACQGHCRMPQLLEGHRQKGNRNLLARGQQHIHLPGKPIGILVDAVGQLDQIVCGIAHGRHHHDNLVSRRLLIEDPLRDSHDLLGGGNGAAPEFLYDKSHAMILLR